MEKRRLVLEKYHRKAELSIINQAIKNVSFENGGVKVIIVRGESGTGKSSLIRSSFFDETSPTKCSKE